LLLVLGWRGVVVHPGALVDEDRTLPQHIGDDREAALSTIATSDEPFDRWFLTTCSRSTASRWPEAFRRLSAAAETCITG
jgi:hypothetical protein